MHIYSYSTLINKYTSYRNDASSNLDVLANNTQPRSFLLPYYTYGYLATVFVQWVCM